MADGDHLAPFAVRASRGRIHPQRDDPLRGPFELDRHRIVECTAFRRLEHKTQVFAPTFHDHFRTRLTHTLEAAQIARTLANALHVNEALAEAIVLAHDLGHPPFGHAGEAALSECMAAHGGFNHNAHTLRVVEYLEHPYPAFRGLNLTYETLDGLRAHETRYDSPAPTGESCGEGRLAPSALGAGSRREGQTAPSVEAQIASLADRVAYDCHDLEDAIGAEFVTQSDLADLSVWQMAQAAVVADGRLAVHAIRRPVLDAILDRVIGDAAANAETQKHRNAEMGPLSSRSNDHAIGVGLSEPLERDLAELEQLLLDRVYRHPQVACHDQQGRQMIHALFDAYGRDPRQLPDRFQARIDEQGPDRVICDYIAGMTDRFCAAEYARVRAAVFGARPEGPP